MAPQAPVGVFVQPPASGTVFGPQNVTEVEGLALTFPEISLRMPRLRMPSVQRSRRDARMELDRATAPFMQQAAPSYAAPAAAAPTYAAPTYAAAPTMVAAAPAPQMMAAPTMMMAPSYAPTMMMQLAPQYVPQAPQMPQAPTPPRAPEAPLAPPCNPQYGPPSPPDCEAPRGPACGPHYGATTQPQPATPYSAVDARLQQLEATERRIDQKMAQLQSAIAEFQPRQSSSSVPARPIGAHISPNQARPLVQPSSEIRPVSPPPVMAAGYAETGRQAQPVSYQFDRGAQAPAEPLRIFQPIQQPSQHTSQVIRQPAS